MSGAFLPAGEPVDLENCHRETIPIPGSIQPHGCLLALRPGSLERLVAAAGAAGPTDAQCDALVAACRDPEAFDDATVLVLRRA